MEKYMENRREMQIENKINVSLKKKTLKKDKKTC